MCNPKACIFVGAASAGKLRVRWPVKRASVQRVEIPLSKLHTTPRFGNPAWASGL